MAAGDQDCAEHIGERQSPGDHQATKRAQTRKAPSIAIRATNESKPPNGQEVTKESREKRKVAKGQAGAWRRVAGKTRDCSRVLKDGQEAHEALYVLAMDTGTPGTISFRGDAAVSVKCWSITCRDSR